VVVSPSSYAGLVYLALCPAFMSSLCNTARMNESVCCFRIT